MLYYIILIIYINKTSWSSASSIDSCSSSVSPRFVCPGQRIAMPVPRRSPRRKWEVLGTTSSPWPGNPPAWACRGPRTGHLGFFEQLKGMENDGKGWLKRVKPWENHVKAMDKSLLKYTEQCWNMMNHAFFATSLANLHLSMLHPPDWPPPRGPPKTGSHHLRGRMEPPAPLGWQEAFHLGKILQWFGDHRRRRRSDHFAPLQGGHSTWRWLGGPSSHSHCSCSLPGWTLDTPTWLGLILGVVALNPSLKIISQGGGRSRCGNQILLKPPARPILVWHIL